jgi:DNA repair protein SbcC/Rad50
MSLLISNLEVSYFGGINGTIALDLTAPLTVIYAPNGTGKTSLIEAVNWAFGSTDVRDPRCRVADASTPTSVKLTVQRQYRHETYERQVDFDKSETRLVDGYPSELIPYLSSMAPECEVSDLHHLSQKKRLVEHLSSNRMLFTHTLTQLIDEASAEARSEAMAELLGTRAQLNALKQIQLYGRRIERRLAELQADAASRRTREAALIAAAKSADVDLRSLTREICSLLITDPPPNEADGQLELETKWSQRHSTAESNLSACERIADALESGFSDLILPQLEAEHAQLTNSADAMRAALLAKSEQERNSEVRLAQLHRERDLLVGVGRIARHISEAVALNSPSASWADVVKSAGEIASRFGNAKNAREAFRVVTEKLTTWPRVNQRLAEIRSAVSETATQLERLPSSESLASALKELHNRRAEIAHRARGLEVARATLLQSLQALDHLEPERKHCPACGHDWDTHARMMAAIKSALEESSAAASDQVASELDLRQQEQALLSQRSSRTSLESRLAQLQGQHNEAARAESELRIPALSFDMTDWRSVTEPATALVEYRIQIAECLESLQDLGVIPDNFPRPQPDGPPSDWLRRLRSYSGEQRDKVAKLSAELAKLRDEREVLQNDVKQVEGRLLDAQAKLSSTRKEHRALQDAAARIQLSELRIENVSLKRRELIVRMDTLQRAFALLHVRKQAIESRRSRGELDQLAAELRPIDSCIERLAAEEIRIAGLSATIEQAAAQTRKTISSQLAPTVSQLFQRMQVNRVFSEIRMNDDLQLAGVLAGNEVEPTLFSAGQRQDLALAFFLSRSYAMGGSFFLDEPLAHLDDLNRVALLDALRAFVLAAKNQESPTRLAITTASWATARHVIEKFVRLDTQSKSESPSLRVYQLRGNVGSTVAAALVYPTNAPADLGRARLQ